MRLGFRMRLFLLGTALLCSVPLLGGFILERYLAGWTQTRVERELAAVTALAASAVERDGCPTEPGPAHNLAKELGERSGARVTLIDRGGRVLGDSDRSRDELGRMDNHGDRPEVSGLGPTGTAAARRHSDTLDLEMIYSARRSACTDGPTVVRAALPVTDEKTLVAQLRGSVAIILLAALGLSALLAAVLSQVVSGKLAEIIASVERLSRGSKEPREPSLAALEGSLARAENRLHKAVKKLAREQDLFESVLTELDEGVIVFDKKGRSSLVNPVALRLLGRSDDGLRRSATELFREPAVLELIERARGGETGEEEVALHRDEELVLEASTGLLPRSGVMLLLRDVTELRRLARVRQDFVANVSHELRNPIASLLADSETLLDGALDDRRAARNFTEAMHRNARRLGALLEDLIDLSRLDARRTSLPLSLIDPTPLLEDAVESALKVHGQRADQVRLEVDPEVRVLAQRTALERVVSNLVDNALRHGGDGIVTVRTRKIQGGACMIEVEDEGPGIPAPHRERVFERFYRVDPARSRARGGTGLGLAIAKNLVEAMNGRISVEAAEPKGSLFRIELDDGTPKPRASADSGPRLKTDERSGSESSVRTAPEPLAATHRPGGLQARFAAVLTGESTSSGSFVSSKARNLNTELAELRAVLIAMAGRCETMLTDSMDALMEQDRERAAEIIAQDEEIDVMEMAIDERCREMLARHKPLGRDLRFITTAMKIVTDLERVGDLVADTCWVIVDVQTDLHAHQAILTQLLDLARATRALLRDALDALVEASADQAEAIIPADQEINKRHSAIQKQVLEHIADDPSALEVSFRLLGISRRMERIGDHAKNIAEQTIFMVRGEDVRHGGA